MGYLDIIDRVLEEQKKEPKQVFGDISLLRLSELAKRNMAIEIYSQILSCEVWLCSNELMVKSVKKDYPAAITYTVDEMKELIRLNPTPEDLKRVHNAKTVFPGSKLADSKFRGDRTSELLEKDT